MLSGTHQDVERYGIIITHEGELKAVSEGVLNPSMGTLIARRQYKPMAKKLVEYLISRMGTGTIRVHRQLTSLVDEPDIHEFLYRIPRSFRTCQILVIPEAERFDPFLQDGTKPVAAIVKYIGRRPLETVFYVDA